ncbi:unnamed protein product [Closterium sp. NIES-65]|nr:unnamed protein product [Closterium sp. NIES-65]
MALIPLSTLLLSTLLLSTLLLATLPLATLPLATLPLATLPLATLPLATLPLSTFPSLPSSRPRHAPGISRAATFPAPFQRQSAASRSCRSCEWRLSYNFLAGTIPAAITTLTNLGILHLDCNQLTGELPSLHHMARLTSQRGLSIRCNYLTATADPPPLNAAGLYNASGIPSDREIVCLFDHNCLADEGIICYPYNQRRASECRAFCGAQPLTPPCSGHGVCSFVLDPSLDMAACEDDAYEPPPPYCDFEGQCDCDEGYRPGPDAGTCVPQGGAEGDGGAAAATVGVWGGITAPSLTPSPPPASAVVGVALSDRALAARQAALDVEITC